jgi:hypothetical protein
VSQRVGKIFFAPTLVQPESHEWNSRDILFSSMI